MSSFDKDIIKPKTAQEIGEAFLQAEREIKEGYLLLAQAEQRMKAAVGDSVGYSGIYTVDHHAGNWSSADPLGMAGAIIYKMKAATWRRIVERLGIRQMMSSKEREALDDKLRGERQYGKPLQEIDDPTHENIMNMLMAYTQTADKKIEGLILEVFKLLTPGAYWNRDLKTNSTFRIGKRVILQNWCGSWYNNDRRDDLAQIDRCFHILDSKRLEGYASPLADALASLDRWNRKLETGETEYFRWKVYQNGNLHLEFKRMDLVKKINQVGGQGSHDLGKGKGK